MLKYHMNDFKNCVMLSNKLDEILIVIDIKTENEFGWKHKKL